MCGFCCIDFIECMLLGKHLLDYVNLFSPNEYKNHDKVIYKYFRTNVSSLKFRLQKIDERRNYLLGEIEHNDLMSEKYKNTCKYLNYVEHLLILTSTITGCVSISAFALLVCVAVGITSSVVGLKFVQSLKD